MSIQSKIDFHLSKEGGFQYNIVIKNETGKMKLPRGVNVSLYDCIIDEIDAKDGENSIFIGGLKSKVLGKLEQWNGNFSAENTTFYGEIFWKKNMRVKLVKDSLFLFRVSAFENTYVDIFNCNWDGFGSFAFRAYDHSRITISKSLLTKRQKGAWAEKGSMIDLNNCTIATETGLYLRDNSQINMIGGELKPTKVGVDASSKCQIYLSHLNSPIGRPSEFDVDMEDWCKLMVHGTDMVNAKTAIRAKKFCTIDYMDFNQIKSTGEDCIILEDNCTARFVDCKATIESEGGNGIKASDHCTINCVDVKLIESKAKHGVRLQDNHTKFEATGKGNGIIQGQLSAVKATNKCSVSIDRYLLVKGISQDGIVLEGDSQGYFSSVQELTSTSANAAKLSNESDISFQDQTFIKGKGANGILADNNCTVNFQTVQSCIGYAGDGIKVSKNTEVDIIYTELINGKGGIGINGESNCDIYVNRSNKITGQSGGIQNITDGSLTVELVKLIAPESGTGITTSGEVDTRLTLIDKINYGTVHTNCDVKIKDCRNVANPGGPAVRVTGGEVNIQNMVANGTGSAMTLSNTYAKASGTTLQQALICSTSEVELNGVTLGGSIVSVNDTITLNRGIINGNITATGSNVNTQLLTLQGLINMNGGTLDIESTSATGSIALVSAHLRASLCAVPSVSLIASSGHFMGGAYGAVTVDSASSVISQKAACVFAGTGSVISMESGPLLPGMNGISVIGPVVTMQDSVQDSVRLTAGTLTITSLGVITLAAPAVAVVTV